MMKIEPLWNHLESDGKHSSGILMRRISGDSQADIYVAVRGLDKKRCLIIKVDYTIIYQSNSSEELKDIAIELIPDENNMDKNLLVIQLSNRLLQDIFTIFCEDLISSIKEVTSNDLIVKVILNRINKWELLFGRVGRRGLTNEEQRGLYGELFFLRRSLIINNDYFSCVFSWVGPDKALRDFQKEGWGVEVKTTHGNNHQKLHISSERQLDTSNLNILFLYHLSLEVQQKHGETLNNLIDSIIELFSDDISSLCLFKTRLMLGGYFEEHRDLYNETGYQIRQESIYNVKDEFPRLEEKDIPKGVGDVKYTIILSDASNYIIEAETLFKAIK